MNTTAKIKAGPGLRILFLIFSLMLALSLFWVKAAENKKRKEWQAYQASYKQIYLQRINSELSRIPDNGSNEDEEKLTRIQAEVQASHAKMNTVFIPGSQTRDLCMTCHLAMENPMFEEDPHPLKRHPNGILKDHPISNFGCTGCHHGQGVGLTVEKAHGFEDNWERPRLPIKYVQSTCFECHENVYGLQGAEKAALGKSLFVEKGCYGCHDARTREDLPKFSSPFNNLSRKIGTKAWLAKWIEDPAKIRPATLMPKFRLSGAQRDDLTAYLYSLEDPEFRFDLSANRKGSAEKGKTLFTEKACVACHSEKADSTGLTRRVPLLSDAGIKYNNDWLINWISDPVTLNPETWMPQLELTLDEVHDLAAYLKALADEDIKKQIPDKIGQGDPAKGKSLAQSIGCFGCHKIQGNTEPAKVGVSVTDVADKRMEELPFGNAVVAHTKWDWIYHKIDDPGIYQTEEMPMTMPDYALSADEVEKLTIFYLFNRLENLPEEYLVRERNHEGLGEKGEWMITHFNCRGCHAVLAEERPRIDQFLAKKSMVPPRIVDETEKVQPPWLYNYLNRPYSMRPWLNIRMPLFNINYADKTVLIRYLHALMSDEKRKTITIPYETALVKSDYDQETLDMGEYRFRNDKCMQCHPVSFSGKLPEGKKLEDLSINLMLAKSRLRFDWIKNFLRNPDQYAGAGTKMPFVYYTPDKTPRIPDPEDWIERTTLFMMFMEKVPAPIETEEKTREVKAFDFDNY